ncbi:SRPBCC domain-containing protein [Streptomyces sp. NPDC093094]|uniref:SRPBCC domain-containing protein n=1 Tax=Streptomyces sp. NPDC093094 TaxID=3366026 RepID=UPI0038131288
MPAELTGTFLALDDGRPAVVVGRVYAHPADRVWTHVTDPGDLARWFPSRAEFELRPGGTVRFGGDPDRPDSTGLVLAVDEPRHLSFEWGGDEIRLDLAPEPAGGTRLTLTNVLADAEAAARSAAGWEVSLTALDAMTRGEPPEQPPRGPGPLWQEAYDGYVRAGFPSGAPVPGVR